MFVKLFYFIEGMGSEWEIWWERARDRGWGGKAISAAGKALKTSWIEIFIEKLKFFFGSCFVICCSFLSFPHHLSLSLSCYRYILNIYWIASIWSSVK